MNRQRHVPSQTGAVAEHLCEKISACLTPQNSILDVGVLGILGVDKHRQEL